MIELNESKVIVIQTERNEHVGFALMHPNLGELNGDCVFTIVPKKAELYETREVDLLLTIKESGEHQWIRNENQLIVSFDGNDILKFSEDGKIVHVPSEIQVGRWKITPGKDDT